MALIKVNGLTSSSEESYQGDGHQVTKRKIENFDTPSSNRETGRPLRISTYEQKRIIVRLTIFIIVILVIQLGKMTIPDRSPACVVDKVLDMLQGVNEWILANPYWRDTMMIMCSLFMDGMFLSLGTYWIFKGKSSRLIVSMSLFYTIRAGIQSIFFSPYTKGYWWFDPGFPSIIVPYGRGSDFFFSGHIGFVTICISEWKVYGNMIMVYVLALGGLYTSFILVAYQVHYSIDIFAGVVFAHWTFMMVDHHKEMIDNFFLRIYWGGEVIINRLTGKDKVEEKLTDL